MPINHRPMIAYIEREKRKKANKKQRETLLALLGRPVETHQGPGGVSDAVQQSDDEVDSDEEEIMKDMMEGDEEESDEESEEEGGDTLQATQLDIPINIDIPIVSKLAKLTEKERLEQLDPEERANQIKTQRLQKVTSVMQDSVDDLETHFVENPYIKLRERASQK